MFENDREISYSFGQPVFTFALECIHVYIYIYIYVCCDDFFFRPLWSFGTGKIVGRHKKHTDRNNINYNGLSRVGNSGIRRSARTAADERPRITRNTKDTKNWAPDAIFHASIRETRYLTRNPGRWLATGRLALLTVEGQGGVAAKWLNNTSLRDTG